MEKNTKEVASVPFYVHEMEVCRRDRLIKRLTWACLSGWIVTAVIAIWFLCKLP